MDYFAGYTSVLTLPKKQSAKTDDRAIDVAKMRLKFTVHRIYIKLSFHSYWKKKKGSSYSVSGHFPIRILIVKNKSVIIEKNKYFILIIAAWYLSDVGH